MADMEEEKVDAGQEDRIAALFKEMEGLKAQNETLRKDIIRMAFSAKPEEREVEDPGPDYSGLPDPEENLKGYLEGQATRTAAYIKQAAAPARPDPQKARADAIVAKFKEVYPDHAKDMDKVEFAAEKAWRKGLAQGLDMERYAYGNPDLFFEDVISEHERAFGKMAPKKEEDKEEDTEEYTDEETARAWGIFGGPQPGGKGKGKAAEKEELGSLTGDIKAMQKKMGLAW